MKSHMVSRSSSRELETGCTVPEGTAAVFEPREPVLMCIRVCLQEEEKELEEEEALVLSAATEKVFSCCCRSTGKEFQYVQAVSRSWIGTGSYKAA